MSFRLLQQPFEARILADWVPNPALLEISHGNAVEGAVDRAGRCQEPLQQRDREVRRFIPSINQREKAVHERPIDGIFRFRHQFYRAPAFPERVLFAAEKRVNQTEVGPAVGRERRFCDGGFEFRERRSELLPRQGLVAARECDATLQICFRRRLRVEIGELFQR